MIPKEIFDFLVELSVNNNREWFQDNKAKYQLAKDAHEEYINKLIGIVNNIDPSIGHPHAKDCIFRIYRDVRFSKFKEPYKNNFGAYIAHGGRKSPYAGYYIHIEPDNSFAGGGIYAPQPIVLKAIREAIIDNPNEYRSIINNKDFTKAFTEVKGDKLKTAPKGFDKNDPNVDLIKHKSYTALTTLSDDEINAANIDQRITDTFTLLKPFNSFINRGAKHAME